MRIAYFDCFSGAAGDMILAALIDAGCPLDYLIGVVATLNLPGVSLSAEKAKRGGISATHVRVQLAADAPRKHRHLSHILRIIDAAGLPQKVADNARRVFTRLADAEAAVHATTVEKVHFHEVGADDAIVDIVCVAAALHQLGVESCVCSAIPAGTGTVRCDHGLMPVPAPATALLLRGAALAACEEEGELTTPTGAAILTALCESYGPLPPMTLSQVGVGAGTREGRTRANILRVLIGESAVPRPSDEHDTVVVLESQLDDATGQVVAHACSRVLEAGALDAYIVPIIMKKGRPGQLVTVLSRPDDAAALEAILFAETPTLGIRRYTCERTTLTRRQDTVQTEFGAIRVKVASRDGAALRMQPEFEDCAAAAREHKAPLTTIQDAARRAWMREHGDSGVERRD
ncbi:hypothetical protein RAS1_36090 [Phycisphaerae bacterium RAS1]|nr:hypothetical protein RAS1_36090 [Phycisphaerae bacterium RAS1]